MSKKNSGIHSGGAFEWYFQRLSGAFLLIALLVHFWVLHFFPGAHGEINYDLVMQRLQNPLWRAFDLLFLICAIYHGMNGVLLIIQDFVRKSSWRVFTTGIVWMAALFYLIVGSITILGLG